MKLENWKLHTGKEDDSHTSSQSLAHRVVLDLLDNDRLKNKGYHVYMDNFYTSPALFRDLRDRGFEACGQSGPTEWAYLRISGQ